MQDLVDSLDVGRPLAGELLARAGEVAQRLHRGRRDEAGPNEPVREQVGEPNRVVHVGFAPGHGLDMPSIGQEKLEVFDQHRPDRLPVHAGGFHGHVRDLMAGEPSRQALQLRGGRAEGLDVALDAGGRPGARRPRCCRGECRAQHSGDTGSPSSPPRLQRRRGAPVVAV